MPRLPQPGADDGQWGDILNDFLLQSHATDGNLNSGVVGTSNIQDSSVTEAKLDAAAQTKLNQTAPVTSVNTQTGDVTIAKADVGLGNVDNTADADKPVSTTQQAAIDAKADSATTITGTQSLTGGGDLSTDRLLSLVGDSTTPGSDKYYGTDGTGSKGFHSLPASGVQSIVAGTGITVDNTDAANPVVSAVSSAGVLLIDYGASVPAGTPVGTIVFQKGQSATTTTWDFRNLSALPSGWVRRGVSSETFDAEGMTATYAAGQGHQIVVGDAVDCTLIAKLISGPTSGAMVGPIIASPAGVGAQATWYNNPVGCLVAKSSSWTYGSLSSVVSTTPYYPTWLRVRKSSTSWYSSYSADGVGWSDETSAIPVDPGSINYVSLGSIFGSATVKVEQISFTLGQALNTGKAQGWWDGSAIQPIA